MTGVVLRHASGGGGPGLGVRVSGGHTWKIVVVFERICSASGLFLDAAAQKRAVIEKSSEQARVLRRGRSRIARRREVRVSE